MKDIISSFFVAFFSVLDGGWRFLITFVLILAIFIINIILTIKVKAYTSKKRRGITICALAIILMQAFSSEILGEGQTFTLFNLSFFLFTLSPLCFITKKEKNQIVLTPEQNAVVQNLQENLKKESVDNKREENFVKEENSVLFPFEKFLQSEEKPTQTIKPSKVEEKKEIGSFDYSNVKKAIEETLKKNLPTEEKRKLIGLEIAILQSERGEDNVAIKEEVNEGLSSLLKIMSRYSV